MSIDNKTLVFDRKGDIFTISCDNNMIEPYMPMMIESMYGAKYGGFTANNKKMKGGEIYVIMMIRPSDFSWTKALILNLSQKRVERVVEIDGINKYHNLIIREE